MPKAQIAKWGNSLAVRIPKAVAEEARLQEGDAILIEVSKGHVELRSRREDSNLRKASGADHSGKPSRGNRLGA